MQATMGGSRVAWQTLGALCATLGLIGATMVTRGTSARADTITISNDTLRTGWDRNEPSLSPSIATGSNFGQLFATPVDGQVYAQPLVVNGEVIVATENNVAYGINGSTGTVEWRRSLGQPWPASTIGCTNLTPNIGVTSTPVYNPATGAAYLTTKVDDGPDPVHPSWYMHALDVTTGLERPGWPVTIRGAPFNDPAHPFNPETALQRPGLLLLDGVVYAAFASHCDFGPYVGYVVGVSTATHSLTTMWSTEAGSSYAEGGIWQSGGGLVSDGSGRIFAATGNGIAPSPGPGRVPPSTLGESVVRLTVGADGNLSAADYFSPANNAYLNKGDADLGSGGPLALPDGYGTSTHPHLLVQVGKDGRVYLLDRDNLGGTAQGVNGTDNVVGMTGPYLGVWGHPAFYGGDGGYVYTVEVGGYLRAFKLVADGSGNPALSSVATSAATMPYTSGSPVVTSSGTVPGSALLWVVVVSGPTGTNATLNAYDAIPTAGILKLRYSAAIGTAAKFSTAATDGGRVYVGTRDGHVLGFGAPTTSPVTASPVDFGSTAVGTSATATATLTATTAVTLTALSTASPFAVTQPVLPMALAAGQTLSVPLSFSPTTWGAQSGLLVISTNLGVVSVAAQGTATQPGLGALPAAVTLSAVPTGTRQEATVSIVNTGTAPETLTGLIGPSKPDVTLSGLPAAGTVLRPSESIAFTVTYAPNVAESETDSLQVAGDAGRVTIALSLSAVAGSAHLTIAPNPLAFGTIPTGTLLTRTFDISNTGNIALTITKAAAPAAPFLVANPVAEGQTLQPGAVIHEAVTYSSTLAQADTGTYQITSNDGYGAQNLSLTGTGVPDAIAAAVARLPHSQIGDPLGPEYPVSGGTAQPFSLGTLFWSPPTGVHQVRGSILASYTAMGGPASVLGFPATDETAAPDGVGRINHFAGGGIYWSPTSGAHEVHGAIYAEFAAVGETGSALGYPITDERGAPDGVGRYNHFTGQGGGSIYWTASTGAHAIYGAIRAEWAATGWERGPNGYPTSDEATSQSGAGRFNSFQNGAIFWTPQTGAHEVHGSIFARWMTFGADRSSLGFPLTDELAGVTGGRFNTFQYGAIDWTAATGAWEVHGAIGAKYNALGAAAGFLGYPLTNESGTPDGVGRFNHFQGGSIYWTPQLGSHFVVGAIRGAWAAQGWERGRLGYPVSDEYSVPGGQRSDFQGGTVSWNASNGTVTVTLR